MVAPVTFVDEQSAIPLFGLDFLGILDRGTNLLEVKPLTRCNLQCRYCFVRSGDYTVDFEVSPDLILDYLAPAIEYKDSDAIEVHVAPYGEFFLYEHAIELLRRIRALPGVRVLSIQTNGTLITPAVLRDLERAGVTRLNMSFNALDPELAAYLAGVKHYDVARMLALFEEILASRVDLLIAPIWFFGKNDAEIPKIIRLVNSYVDAGHEYGQDIWLGIQNYLVYKTGRKLSRVRQRDFGYFYRRLAELERETGVQLKLSPSDFHIHPCRPLTPPVNYGDVVEVAVVSPGRTPREYIGRLNPDWAVKVLSRVPLPVGSRVRVEIIKQKTRENLLTAAFNP